MWYKNYNRREAYHVRNLLFLRSWFWNMVYFYVNHFKDSVCLWEGWEIMYLKDVYIILSYRYSIIYWQILYITMRLWWKQTHTYKNTRTHIFSHTHSPGWRRWWSSISTGSPSRVTLARTNIYPNIVIIYPNIPSPCLQWRIWKLQRRRKIRSNSRNRSKSISSCSASSSSLLLLAVVVVAVVLVVVGWRRFQRLMRFLHISDTSEVIGNLDRF